MSTILGSRGWSLYTCLIVITLIGSKQGKYLENAEQYKHALSANIP